MQLVVGQIVRHKGERKVVRQVYRNKYGEIIIQFVDRTESKNYQDIELDGRK
jgi:hypothetical protein